MLAPGGEISPGMRGGILTSEPHLTSELKKPPTNVVQRITLRLATEAYGDFCVAAMIDSLFLEGKRKSFDNQTHIPSDYVIILNPMSPQQFLMLVNCKFITFN